MSDQWYNAVIEVLVPFDTVAEAAAFMDGALIDRVMDAVNHDSAVMSGTVELARDDEAVPDQPVPGKVGLSAALPTDSEAGVTNGAGAAS